TLNPMAEANQNPTGETGAPSLPMPTPDRPNDARELLGWCQQQAGALRDWLVDHPSAVSGPPPAAAREYADRAAAYALVRLPSDFASAVISPGPQTTLRDAIEVLDRCAEACERSLRQKEWRDKLTAWLPGLAASPSASDGQREAAEGGEE